MPRAVFLDRDGVINRKAPEGQYITRWEDMEILPGAADAIGALNRAGFLVIVASNQRCIAKGLLTCAALESLHRLMSDQLASGGGRIDAIYYCPHDYGDQCNCRKPAPGMLLQAAERCRIDLPASWMIGDSASDIEAGRRAGCQTVALTKSDHAPNTAHLSARSLPEAVELILAQERIG